MNNKRIFCGSFIRHNELDEIWEQARYYLDETGRFKWTRTAANLHITFHFFGDTEADKIEKIKNILVDVLDKRFEIPIQITGLDFFKRRNKPAVLYAVVNDKTGKLSKLYLDIQQSLFNEKLIEKINRRFVPHITFARIKSVSNDFYDELEVFNNQWNIIDIPEIKPQLIESVLLPKGALYKAL